MTDSDLRKQLLLLCNVLKDHLALTAKLESAIDILLSHDPSLKAHYDAAQSEEQQPAERRGDVPPRSASELLLQVTAEIRELAPPQISWERDSR